MVARKMKVLARNGLNRFGGRYRASLLYGEPWLLRKLKTEKLFADFRSQNFC